MEERIYLNNDWRFTENYSEELLKADFDVSKMTSVRLPHTCMETPFHYFDEHIYQIVSGYRKILAAPKDWEWKKILLTIDGAAHESEVFLNGEKIGEHHCGYTAFTVDIGEKLIFGEENILVVKVDSREDRNIPPFGFVVDYMTYGGIYRDVYLEVKNPNYVQDIFVRSEVKIGEKVKVKITSEITLNEITEEVSIRQYLKMKNETEYKFLGEISIFDTTLEVDFQYSKG